MFSLPSPSFLEFVTRQGIPATRALPACLQSYLANLVTAAVRLIRLGQTNGQLAVAKL
jgi:urease accessory protein